MAYDDTLIVDHIKQTHNTELLSEREKHLIGLAVTMTRGCQACTRNRVEKARSIGLTDDELNALVAVTSAVNSGVTAATARIAFGMLEEENAAMFAQQTRSKDFGKYKDTGITSEKDFR